MNPLISSLVLVFLAICLSDTSGASPPKDGCPSRVASPFGEAGVWVAFDGEGVLYKNRRFSKLEAVYDPKLHTHRFQSATQRVAPDAEVLVLLLHGFGADYSHAGSVLNPLSTFLSRPSGLKTSDKRFSLSDALAKEGAFFPVGGEAIDLPFSGSGPRDEAFQKLEHTVTWLVAALKSLRAEAPRLPIVPIARSGSTGLLLSVLQVCPDCFDGLVLVSPGHPTVGFDDYIALQQKLIREKQFVPNLPGMEFILGQYRQMRDGWARASNPFGKIPTLVLTGEKDFELMPGVREVFRESVLASRALGFPSDFWDVEGAGHDVISTLAMRPEDIPRVVAVWKRVYAFLGQFRRKP